MKYISFINNIIGIRMDLLPLSEHERRASLGIDYKYLTNLYPSWAQELHTVGNILPNSKLEPIAIHGIIRWYMEQKSPYDIDYPYRRNISRFIKNHKLITFYDFIKLYTVYTFHQLNFTYFDFDKKYQTKYSFLLEEYYLRKLPKHIDNESFSKYCIKPFYYFLIDKMGLNNLIEFLKIVNCLIDTKNSWFEHDTIFDTFLIKNPEVKKWGIIFQRFKIIVEKMEYIKHKDIYKLNNFVELVQSLLYTTIYYYIECSNKITIEHPIILKLMDDRLLKPYPTQTLINDDFNFLF